MVCGVWNLSVLCVCGCVCVFEKSVCDCYECVVRVFELFVWVCFGMWCVCVGACVLMLGFMCVEVCLIVCRVFVYVVGFLCVCVVSVFMYVYVCLW